MSGKGNCYDRAKGAIGSSPLARAAVETFFKTIKAELIWRRSWETRRQTETAIFPYINGFYNPRRRHWAEKAPWPSNARWPKRDLRAAQKRDKTVGQSGNQIASIDEVSRLLRAQKLVPTGTIETFDKADPHGLAQRDMMPFDLGLGGITLASRSRSNQFHYL